MNRMISALAFSLLCATSATALALPQATGKATEPPADKHDTMSMGDMDMKDMDMKGMKMGDDAGKAEFARLDANHDGKLSRAELGAKNPLVPHFEMLDANHDGSLSPAEFAAGNGM